jgi:hypothetical protein
VDARISVITLGVADVPWARAFYQALGWPLSGEPEGTSRIRTDTPGRSPSTRSGRSARMGRRSFPETAGGVSWPRRCSVGPQLRSN